MQSASPGSLDLTWAAFLAGLRSAMLALVDTRGESQFRLRAAAMGCWVTRIARVSCLPLSQYGRPSAAGNSQVFGPGQLSKTGLISASGKGFIKGRSCS